MDGEEWPAGAPAGFLHLTDSRSPEHTQTLAIRDCDIFKIGRDPDTNSYVCEGDLDHSVSRNHCEVYVVVYEPSVCHIYVRDRKSFNGTFVNGQLVGCGPGIASGHLLQDGDVIQIKPHWNFAFEETHATPTHDLTSLQAKECELFSHKYTLTTRCLGEGAEATVHLAVDIKSQSQLVCKVQNLDRLNRTDRNNKRATTERERLLQEVDVLRQLHHPHILSYVEAVVSPHSLYTFVELASGGDLMSFIYRHDRIPEFDTRVILRQVISGLQYLHRMGVVHRDLKPENILLLYSPRIAYSRVVLSDFGTCAIPERSCMKTNVGTANYQAPEFILRSTPHTAAVDIWSLGVVALILLTSGSDSDIRHLNQIEQNELEDFLKGVINSLTHKPSANAEKFLRGCLQVSPLIRFNVTEAARHSWLTQPKAHLDWFNRLETRLKAEHKGRAQVRPMPLRLPDLGTGATERWGSPPEANKVRFSSVERQVSGMTSRFFQAQGECFPKDSQEATSQADVIEGAPPMGAKNEVLHMEIRDGVLVEPKIETSPPEHQEERSPFKKPIIVATKTPPKRLGPQTPVEANRKVTTGSLAKKSSFHFPYPWTRSPEKKYGSKTYGKGTHKRANVRIPERFLVPRPGLDRHLRPKLPNHQQEVLDELKRTKSQFLTDYVPTSQ